MNKANYWAIVPAAGVGKRMGTELPKQYLPLFNQPILQHTLTRLRLPAVRDIIVALADDDPYWHTLQLPFTVTTVIGGAERCHSVLNGLHALQARAAPDDWVLVHDAARPCVRSADIEKLMTMLADHPVGGILAVPVRDTMKRADAQQGIVATVSRNQLWHALTPQMFRLQALTTALETVLAQDTLVTDDAQAMELQGLQPQLVAGHADNIKITHPQDLQLATLFLQQQEAASCVSKPD